jgi:high-affinity Fe2+/Pb2+ permease
VQPISAAFEIVFLSLQVAVVTFLLFHDWVPLGRLNNLSAIRKQDSLLRSVFVTLLPVVPAALGLFYSVKNFGRTYPDWLEMLLWITYGLFVVGILRAWWIPYLVKADPERAARYQIIFAGTHRFLPERNGMAPDTLHIVFHLVTVATLVALFIRDRL